MDDRRRTISSEEQIGEALMRVSNTLEAQRLTKSLEYQEKLRRRTAFRMVLSVLLFVTLAALLLVGGVLLFVLWKYMDPILNKLLPFLDTMVNDFEIIWRALVESSTYMPIALEKSMRLMDELIIAMQNMNGLPLRHMMVNLNNLLGTTNGLLLGTSAMLKDLSEGMKPLMAGLSDGMGVLGSMMEDIGGSLGTMMRDFAKTGSIFAALAADSMEVFAKAMSQIDVDKLIQSIAAAVNNLPALIETTGEALASGSEALAALMQGLADNSDETNTMIVELTKGMTNLGTELSKLKMPFFLT